MDSRQKVNKCILECSKNLSSNVKEYLTTMSKGLGPVKALVAHITTLKEIQRAEIEDTYLYRFNPDIKIKLEKKIDKCISEEKDALQQIIDRLEKIHSKIEKLCDSVFSIYNCEKHHLSLETITERSENALCISEKMEALDKFKRNFYDNHNSRVFSIIYLDVGGELKKVHECWNASKLESFLEDLQCTLLN